MKKKVIIGCSIIGILIISIILYLVLVNKNKKDIRGGVEEFFNCVKQEEQTTKNKYLSVNNVDIKEILDNSEYYKILVQDLDYTILSLEGDFNDATVLVEVSNKNSEESIKEFLKKRKETKKQLVEETTSEESESDETENNIPTDGDLLEEQVESAKTDKNIIKFELHKENKKWIISDANKSDILNVVLPDIDNISEEFIEEINKEEVEEPTEKTEEVNAQDNSKGTNNKKASNKQNTSSSTATSSNNASTQTSNPAPAQQQAQQPTQTQSQSNAPTPSVPAPSASQRTPVTQPVDSNESAMSAPSNDPVAQPDPATCPHTNVGSQTSITAAGIMYYPAVCMDCGAILSSPTVEPSATPESSPNPEPTPTP